MTEPSTTIIEAVADWKQIDSTELDQPLYEVLDPDALDTLLDADGPVRVTFEYDELCVSVDSSGEVDLTPKESLDRPPRFEM